MATYIKILNNNDIASFENPPEFNGEERKHFFYLPQWTENLVESFRTPTNQVGFILQFGYFKATGRFFVTRKFHQNDVEFIAGRLDIQLDELDLENYTTGSFLRHQEIILNSFGKRVRCFGFQTNEAPVHISVFGGFLEKSKDRDPQLPCF